MHKRFIDFNCEKRNCPHFSTCCRVPTEVITHDGRVGIDVLIFGMGAGKDEERLRRCFVGRAGKYMRQVIKYLWDNVTGPFNIAISNNVRFHPMDENGKDREPTKEEINHCINFLVQDIISLNPLVIIPVGRNATRTFLPFAEDVPMGKMRGTHRVNIYGERTIVPTYHPSFLCRNYGSFKPEENNLYDRYFAQDFLRALTRG